MNLHKMNSATDRSYANKAITEHKENLKFFREKLLDKNLSDSERIYCENQVKFHSMLLDWYNAHYYTLEYGRI